MPAAAPHVTVSRMSSPRAIRRTPIAIVTAIVAALVLAPAAWAGQASVRAYGGAGGNIEHEAGPITPPGGTVTPPPSVTPPSVTPPPAVSPPPPGGGLPPTGEPPVYKTPVATTPGHSLLSLPRTGFTIALLIGAGLLLTGVGLVTRRVAGAVERSA